MQMAFGILAIAACWVAFIVGLAYAVGWVVELLGRVLL